MKEIKLLKLEKIFVAAFVSSLFVACAASCDKDGADNGAHPTAVYEQKEQASAVSAIDGKKALSYIEEVISFGPRYPGTEGAEKTRRYIIEKLKSFGLVPKRYDFVALTPHPELGRVQMANIVVDIGGEGKRVLIGGHYDGKILEGINFKGANDGGSSTALLLEMARVLSDNPPTRPVRLAFFDGEEAFVSWSDTDSLYGSKKMAAELKRTGEFKEISAVVIVDMIGDKRLRITRDTLSTPWVFAVLEQTAMRLGRGDLFRGPRASIEDDHVPFLHIGIPAAVLIDLKFGPGFQSNAYWHTEKDTIDKLSPESIEAVGQVVLLSLPELSKR